MLFRILMLLMTVVVVYPASAGVFNKRSLVVNGVKREYVVKMPDAFDAQSKLPLILALNGDGDSWKKFNNNILRKTLEKSANQYQAVLIYPIAMKGYWDDDMEKDLSAEWKHDDVRFMDHLIQLSVEKYYVDAKKVYITGMANGGMMAIKLAIKLSEKIAAVAVVSSLMEFKTQFLKLNNPLSFLLINGSADTVFPYNGGKLPSFKFIKNNGKALSSQQTTDYFVNNGGCDQKATISRSDQRKHDMTSVVIKTYHNCHNNALVRLVKVVDAGHAWPGGKQYLPIGLIGRVSKEFNASEMIVEFFLGELKH